MKNFYRTFLTAFFTFLLTFSAVAQVPVRRAVPLDFDGDGKTDLATVRFSQNPNNLGAFTWYIRKSSDGQAIIQPFGNLNRGDKLVPLDYDGDGKTDIAIYRAPNPAPSTTPATFYILQSSNGFVRILQWGITDDNPFLTQDFDGDGKADPTAVRNAFCQVGEPMTWYILLSSSNYTQARIENFGNCRRTVTEDFPIRGDFDGDGKADLAFYRAYELNPNGTQGAVSNTFNIKMSGKRKVMKIRFGCSNGCAVVEGDFDGDGKTDMANSFYNSSRLWWRFIRSSDGGEELHQFGYANSGAGVSDGGAPGDYDSDGKTDLGVSREDAFGLRYFIFRSSLTGQAVWWQWGLYFENTPASELYLRAYALQ